MTPVRVTLSRAKGWRMPPNTVKVSRPTIWGNPFTIEGARDAGYSGSDAGLAVICVTAFRAWINGSDRDWVGDESEARRTMILARLPDLRGKNLACWCKPGTPCHADVLLALANEVAP